MSYPALSMHYPFEERLPALGSTIEVAPGICWVRMPLPFDLDHINLWLIRDHQAEQAGWSLVDSGLANDMTRSAWETIFAQELEGLPILRVLATHMHPDHLANAEWLLKRWQLLDADCRFWMSATDYYAAYHARSHPDLQSAQEESFFLSHGLQDTAILASLKQQRAVYAILSRELPIAFRRLWNGVVVPIGQHDWTCLGGYGHAPEHISFYNREQNVLIAGDMLLPQISPNISVLAHEPDGNPLKLYLNSIQQLTALPQDTLILPSHGRPFFGLQQRVQQLQSHHAERLELCLQHCRQQPSCAMDILPVIFKRSLHGHQIGFALGEAIAHLHYLWHDKALHRVKDGAGIWRFQAA